MEFKFSKISESDFRNGNVLIREISAKVYDIEENTMQKNGEKYGRFWLRQGRSRIVALAFGMTYELVKQVLKKSKKVIKFPCKTFYCKPKNNKFASNSTCKYDLFFTSSSTYIHAARSTVCTTPIRSTPKDDTLSLQKAISQLLKTPTQAVTRKVKSIKFKDGKIYRYWGCETCSFSIPRKDTKDGKYYCKGRCNNDKTRKSAKGVPCERKICFTIYDLQLLDDKSAATIQSIVVYNRVCELLLKKFGHEFDTDDEAAEAWQTLIERSRFDITLKRNKKKKSSQYAPQIFVEMANKVVEDGSLKPLEMESGIVPAADTSPGMYRSDKSEFVVDASVTCDKDETEGWPETDFSLNIKKEKKRYPKFLKYKMKLLSTAQPYSAWAEAYQINSKPRGLVLLINNYNFPHREKEPQRLGSEVDIECLMNGFTEMGYRIYGDKCQVDIQTPREFGELIRCYKDQLLEKEVDSIFIVISSHGSNLQVDLCDGGSICLVEELMIPFSDDQFPQYQGKPKVFMPIVCQDLGRLEFRDALKWQTNKLFDMLVCCPCLPGYSQNRSSVKGTLFVNRLMFNMMTYARSWDFEQILKKVQHDVADQIKNKHLEEWTVPHHHGSTFRPMYLVPQTTTLSANVEEQFTNADMEID